MSTTSIDPATLRPAPSDTTAKRVLDVGLTLVILALIWPILGVIALAVAVSSPGPVLFRQTRVGRNGVTFAMFKFRSMYRDAEARRAELMAQSDRDGICLKLKHDPRITPVGRVLRRWSLDELPQLLNVIQGNMSLVGPRPALVEEVALYPDHAHLRHRVKPGITGFWQVAGRADIGFDDMILLDLDYVRRASLVTDITVMFQTFRAVLSGRGAY